MSLLRPTTGDLLDRLAVLALKIAMGRSRGLPVGHFEEEEDEISRNLDRWEDRDVVLVLYPTRAVLRLAQVNLLLWQATDRHAELVTKDYTEQDCFELGRLLKALYDLNRERHRLVEEIDRATGEFRGEEKV